MVTHKVQICGKCLFAGHDPVFRGPAGLQEAEDSLCSSCRSGSGAILYGLLRSGEDIADDKGGGIKGAGSLGLGLWLAKPAAPLLDTLLDGETASVPPYVLFP